MLLEGDYLTNAAVMMFHKDPDRIVPGSYVKIGYFETGSDLLYQDEVHGSLVTLVDKVIEILYLKYLKGIIHYEGIQRVDQYPIDNEAAREAILNSLIHKDNTQGVPVQIKVFPDRVFIYNAGKLPEQWSIDTLYGNHGSKPRNPKIASAMFRTGMIEAWGRGIEKIINGSRRIDAPDPVFKEIGGDMSVEFFAPEDAIFQSTGQATGQVQSLLNVLGDEELDVKEIMLRLGLVGRENFRQLYLNPALELGFVERTMPDKPTSPKQKYRRT